MKERRRFPRIDTAVPVRYKKLRGESAFRRSAVSKNIGEGGICFSVNDFLPFACHLTLEINLPGTPKPVKAVSKIAWIKKGNGHGRYEIGNQFIAVSREDGEILTDFAGRTLSR